ncbi:glycosyltransferase family 9 protein, partial [Planctomycetota bacterium]
MTDRYQRILIIKPSALGDIVLALPALSLIRTSFPEAQISWLVCPEFAPLLEGHPYINDLIHFDRRSIRRAWRSKQGWYALRDLVRELRSHHFDVVFDFQGLLRTGLAGRLTGAPDRFGPANAREGAPLFYSHRIKPDEGTQHLVDHYHRIVTAAGGHV